MWFLGINNGEINYIVLSLENFKNAKFYRDNIWGADLAVMILIEKHSKVRKLLLYYVLFVVTEDMLGFFQ